MYDPHYRLKEVAFHIPVDAEVSAIIYGYDASSKMNHHTLDGVTTAYTYDGAAAYTPGISEHRGSTTTFLHSGLKNADAQSGVSQSLTAARHYDAFGNLLGASGSWQGPFGYAGVFGYQEDTTGLMLLGHRLYEPSTCRFLTRDPIKVRAVFTPKTCITC